MDLEVDAVAVGGEGVARDDGGRVVFVEGGLPGETVRAELRDERARYARARVLEVRSASPDRVEPACPHVGRGCGGCAFAHVATEAQRRLKVDMIRQALDRIGGLSDAVVEPGPPLPADGFRTTVRAAVAGGRAGYRMAHGHDRVAVDSCRVAHPLVEEMIVEGSFGDADEVTLRVGARTGDRLALVAPTAAGVRLPDDVLVVGADELAAGRRAWIHEVVAGVRLRVSAASFFQSRPDGAEALVEVASAALGDVPASSPLLDLYCGVGLFAATLGQGRPVVAVERSRSSVADAKVNLAGTDARVVRSAVERWRPSPGDAVVADPPRSGLGRTGVEKVCATGASHLALVSCDAGALGRDARLLREHGWRHQVSTLVDLFADTPHVEVVSRFVR